MNAVDEEDALLAGQAADPWEGSYDSEQSSAGASSSFGEPGRAYESFRNEDAWTYTSDGSLDHNDDADISATDTETVSSLGEENTIGMTWMA